MKVSARHELPAGPDEVFAIITTQEFQDVKGERTSVGAFEATITQEGEDTRIRSERRFSSADLPEIARSFIGPEFTAIETQVWGPAQADGSRSVEVSLEIPGAPMTMSGTASLTPGGAGSVEELDAEVKSTLPFIGKSLEKAAAPMILQAMEIEVETIREFLAR